MNEARLIYQILAKTCKGQTQSFHGNHSTVICNCRVQQLPTSKTSPWPPRLTRAKYPWLDQEEEREDEGEEEQRRFRRYNIIVFNEEEKARVGPSADSF